MEKKFSAGGSEYIKGIIDKAIADGLRTATISGNWEIDSEIRLPSDFELVLENCHLRLADGSFTNIFVNEYHGTDAGRRPEGTDRNISIIGRGEAILDGGNYNGLSEKTQCRNGLPPIWKNNMVLFTNVDGFRITGLHCRNQRWWALNFIYCANGYLGNLDFCSNDLMQDENGNLVHGLRHSRYADVLVKNADGIDLRQGCHDIIVENITGFTEDDSVALTGLNGRLESEFAVEGMCSDICRIDIRNVATAAFCTNVRLLNQDGIRLHDIEIDGVRDMSAGSPHMDKGIYAVRIGDNHMYGSRHSTCDETYNIRVRNVCGGGEYVISLAGATQNLVISDIEAIGDTPLIDDNRTEVR